MIPTCCLVGVSIHISQAIKKGRIKAKTNHDADHYFILATNWPKYMKKIAEKQRRCLIVHTNTTNKEEQMPLV